MDKEQMEKRCPTSTLLGKGVLNDYTLGFTIYSPKRKCGCADIIKSSGKEVWGLIYSVTPEDIESLDYHEGAPIHYRRIQVEIIDGTGNRLRAETYEVVNKSAVPLVTSEDYLSKLTTAAKIFSFPETYQEFLNSFSTI